MAEKDERIEISKYDLSNTEWNGDCPIDIHKVYTRQEAIERMAKALAFVQSKTFVNKDQWEIVMRCCRYEAESALNALLEVEK